MKTSTIKDRVNLSQILLIVTNNGHSSTRRKLNLEERSWMKEPMMKWDMENTNHFV